MTKNKIPTKQEIRLFNALHDNGIVCKSQYRDGPKTVDIFIPSAKLFIEVDGLPHFENWKKIASDLKRDWYSDAEGIVTMHIPNEHIDSVEHFPKIVDAIVKLVNSRTSLCP